VRAPALLTLALLAGSLLLTPAPLPGAGAPAVYTVARAVAPEATAENSQRKLAVDDRGRLYLIYVRPDDGQHRIVLGESGDGGRSWQSTALSAPGRPARLPSLSLFPDRSLHVVWTDFGLKGRILHRVRRAGRWTDPVSLSVPGVYAGVPVVAPLREQPHVLWYGILPERPQVATRHGAVYQILATRRQDGKWTPPLLISTGVPDSINPTLAADGRAVLHAAWFQFDGRVYQVRYARFSGRWEEPRSLTTGNIDHTNVALDASGADVHLVWEERGPRHRIMSLRSGQPPAVLATGDVADPVIAAAGGRAVAAWSAGGRIILRQVHPPGPLRTLGDGAAPAVAVRGAMAYVAWVSPDRLPDLRITAVPLP
jgi:hypothetical protein